MAGRGRLPPTPNQQQRNLRFRVSNSAFDFLAEFCLRNKMTKQELFEGFVKSLQKQDARSLELAEEFLENRRQKRGFDEIDKDDLRSILEEDGLMD